MRTVAPLLVGLVLVLGCSSLRPVAINTSDVCESCKRVITNTKVAAEIVEPNGLAKKFRTVTCMVRYMNQHPSEGAVFVTDFKTGRFLSPQSAVFVKAEIDENTRESNYLAFNSVPTAVEFGRKRGASPVDWASVVRQTAAAGN
jgi:hypothetical protein